VGSRENELEAAEPPAKIVWSLGVIPDACQEFAVGACHRPL